MKTLAAYLAEYIGHEDENNNNRSFPLNTLQLQEWIEQGIEAYKSTESMEVIIRPLQDKAKADCDIRHWMSTTYPKIRLTMTVEQARAIYNSGQYSVDITSISKDPKIQRQLYSLDESLLRAYMKERAYACHELADHRHNLLRVLWIAGCEIIEQLDDEGKFAAAAEIAEIAEVRHWWTSTHGRIELSMTAEQAESVHHTGQCDADVKVLSNMPDIREQVVEIDAAILVKVLLGYGTWNIGELHDHRQNIQKLLWIAGSDIAEQLGVETD